jgi:hypothetical protein
MSPTIFSFGIKIKSMTGMLDRRYPIAGLGQFQD